MKGTLAALLTALMLGSSGVLAEESDRESEGLKVGYSGSLFTDTSFRDVQVAIELWAKQVSAKMGKTEVPQITLFDDLEAIARATQNGEVDLLSLSTLDYLRIRDRVALEPALVSVIGEGAEQEYLLLVRRDREMRMLEELHGGQLMVEVGKSGESVSRLWLDSQLLKRGLEETERFFGMVKQVRKTSQDVLPVFFGQRDAALVRKSSFETLTELNPQLERELTALTTSPRLLPALACFPAEEDAEIKRFVRKAVLTLHQSPKGKQILTMFQAEKILPFSPELLEPVADLVRDYDVLKERSGGGK